MHEMHFMETKCMYQAQSIVLHYSAEHECNQMSFMDPCFKEQSIIQELVPCSSHVGHTHPPHLSCYTHTRLSNSTVDSHVLLTTTAESHMLLVATGHRCHARNDRAWAGGRGTVGASQGQVYYEVTVADEGLCRVGWSTRQATLDLGTDPVSFGFGGTGETAPDHLPNMTFALRPYAASTSCSMAAEQWVIVS